MRNQSLVVFLVVAMLACIPTMAYNNVANLFLNSMHYRRPAALMTLGQLSDLIVLGLTPWLVKRCSLRTLFVGGIVAWAVRYALLAAASFGQITWPAYAAILMNGPCFVFIYVVGVMHIDHLVRGAHRGAAQGVFVLATAGLGNLGGALMVGFTQSTFLTPEGISPPPYDWPAFWSIPALLSAASMVVFVFFFKRNDKQETGGIQISEE
jgi:hypothetical protein